MGNHDVVVLLRNMPKAVYVKIDEPKAVYVKIDDSDELFLKAAPVTAARASQPAGPDLRGVLAITPQCRPWKFKAAGGGPAIPVSRTQLPVLPRKQGTLHGVQGKTADPGFIVHWTFPPGPSSSSSSRSSRSSRSSSSSSSAISSSRINSEGTQ